MPILSSAARLWNRAQRWVYSRWYGRLMRVPHSQLEVSGPCLIHGGGKFQIGRGVAIRSSSHHLVELYCAPGATLTLGDGCFLNQGVHVVCSTQVSIGDGCLLADEALVMDSDFHAVGASPAKSALVRIERGSWVGARAIILKGVTIGEGAVVGAGAVVARSVPARSLVVGNPARVVRQW